MGQVRDPQLPMHHPLGTRIEVSPPVAKNDGCCLTVRLLVIMSPFVVLSGVVSPLRLFY